MGRDVYINTPFWCDYGYNTKIGDNSVIAAGSVVTRDIPSNVVAAGVPCRVMREITEADKDRYPRYNGD